MNLDEALKYIHSVSWLGTIPGLERELELLERMGFTRAAEQDGMICLLVGKAVFLNRKYLF